MRNKHMYLMLACALIPLAALTAVFLFGVSANSVVIFGMILLCPALHFLMMRGMMGGHHHDYHTLGEKFHDRAEPTPHHPPARRGGG